MLHYEKLQLYLRLVLKLNKNASYIRIESIKWLKPYVEFNTQKIMEVKRMEGDWNMLSKLLKIHLPQNNGKLDYWIYVKSASKKKKKHYLKSTSKLNYMSQNIFDNKLVAIRKNKVTLILNKPAYVGMCIFELSKVLMYKFHYGYPEIQDYSSPTTIV